MAATPDTSSGDWFDQQGIVPPVTAPTTGSQQLPTADQTPYNGLGMVGAPGTFVNTATNNPPQTGTGTYAPGSPNDPNSDPLSQFQAYLAKYPGNPQAAIDAWNQVGDPGGLKPQYYADKNVIGVSGQNFAYLVAPGTGANPAGGAWQQAGTPNADASGASASTGTMAPAAPVPSAYAVPQYTLPTLDQIRATPGYQFAQDQANQGIERSAVAKGGLGGGTLKDLSAYDIGLGDQYAQQAVGNSLSAFGANTAAGQFGANYGLAANQQGFGQNLATNQFNLGAQGQIFNQGLAENENAFNQYNTNQNTAFNQWLATANIGNPGNPFA